MIAWFKILLYYKCLRNKSKICLQRVLAVCVHEAVTAALPNGCLKGHTSAAFWTREGKLSSIVPKTLPDCTAGCKFARNARGKERQRELVGGMKI